MQPNLWSWALILSLWQTKVASSEDPTEGLPTEIKDILDKLLDGNYIEGTIKAIEYLRNHSVDDHYVDVLRYLHSKGSSLHSLQASYSGYFSGIEHQPRRLAADLRQMVSGTFLLTMKYLYSDQTVELLSTRVDFQKLREQIVSCRDGSRSLFVMVWERCLPRLSTSQCLELLTKALRLSSGAYLQPEMVTEIPQDLPEETFRNITAVLKELYDELTARSQRAVYEWIRRILQRPRGQVAGWGTAPRALTLAPPSSGEGPSWITAESLWFLGRFVVHLPPEEIQKISLNEIRRFINYGNATKQLDSVYDITSTTARAFQKRISASGFDMANTSTVYRLGLLVCFFDNVQELDMGEARSLLHQMIKCSRLKGFQADVKKLKAQLLGLVLRSQRLNETLDSISDAIACLSLTQLDSLSSETVQSAIPILGTVSGWTLSQMVVLADKFLGDGQLSLFNLSQLGVLVPGVGTHMLYNTSPRDLVRAVRGPLSQHGPQLSTPQRMAVVTQVAASSNVSSWLDLLNSSFLEELSLSTLLGMQSFNISHLGQKELRRSQALFLYELALKTLAVQEIVRFGELVRGLTCQQLQSLDQATFLQLDVLLQGSFPLMSPHQLNCLAWKYLQDAPGSMPSLLLVTLPTAILASTPQSACRPLLTALERANLSAIVPNPARRAQVIGRALWCLNYTIQDEYDVDILGRTICYLPPEIIKTNISNKAMNEALIQFRLCRNLSLAQKREIRNKIQEYYGDPAGWQPELLQDLGPLVTLLSKEDLTTVAEKFPDILLQSALEVKGMTASQDFLLAVFHALEKTSGSLQPSNTAPGCGGIRSPTSDQILKLADANSYWSAQELSCLSPETFVRSVELLGGLRRFSMAQLVALKEKAKEVWGPVQSWRNHQIQALGRIAVSLSEREIMELDLGSIDTIAALSQHEEWSPLQVRSLLEGFLQDSGQMVRDLKGWDLAGLGTLLCAMTGSEVDSISVAAYSIAAARVGQVSCRPAVLRQMLTKARRVFGDVSEWHSSVLWEVGLIAAGMSGEEIKTLRPDLMPYFKPEAMAALPTDVLKELSPEQLTMLGPENAAALTQAQEAVLNPVQIASLLTAREGARSDQARFPVVKCAFCSGLPALLPTSLCEGHSIAGLSAQNMYTALVQWSRHLRQHSLAD
ncbi:otoancorin-like isoform X2 [Narcine bancroftii]|uniref:otoancorin-like isoform X2 n=1 Tax=Narcine bancroftii TaxID=1343680 RepID=UPI003831CACF